ncbi:MAG: hypothetical protein KAT00_00360, partial [Planctomycetes bacterium]|nr:hypothetical protein [Planctomycetota bacterium]
EFETKTSDAHQYDGTSNVSATVFDTGKENRSVIGIVATDSESDEASIRKAHDEVKARALNEVLKPLGVDTLDGVEVTYSDIRDAA